MSKIKDIQIILGVTPDGVWGVISKLALDAAIQAESAARWHAVIATSFADPADVAAYRKAKAAGMSDQEAFKHGDNGIGCWGDDTTADTPMCALPPEDWKLLTRPRGAKVEVQWKDKSGNPHRMICSLGDTMPHKVNITNGAGIDLNPAACQVMGLNPPIRVGVTWRFL